MGNNKRLATTPCWFVCMMDDDEANDTVHTAVAYCIRPVGADGLPAGVYGSFNGSVGIDTWQVGHFHIDFYGEPTIFTTEEIEEDAAREQIHVELMQEIWALAEEDDDRFCLTAEGRGLRSAGDDNQEFMSTLFSTLMLRGVSRRWPLLIKLH